MKRIIRFITALWKALAELLLLAVRGLKKKAKGVRPPSEPPSTSALRSVEDELDIEFDRVSAEDSESVSLRERARAFLCSMFNLRGAVLLGCFVVFAVCAVMLVGRIIDFRRSDELYDMLAEDMFGEVSDAPSVLSGGSAMGAMRPIYDYNTTLTLGKSEGELSENTQVVDIEYARIRAKLEEIRSVNPDIIGWLKIDGTAINYPVVLGEDNEYYLTHAYNGEYLRSGTIFADCKNNKSVYDNRNLVLYGHNMANGSMFAAVKKFFRDPSMLEGTEIYFYSFDGVYVYEPALLLDTDTALYYYQIDFFGRGEYEHFLTKMQENAKYKREGLSLTADDKLITFSTCTNRTVSGRYVIQARLSRVENSTRK
ncbi:MAG: class B sortase [Clostridia bacterium]|nr:class B sortase [Clostridia bacterium]